MKTKKKKKVNIDNILKYSNEEIYDFLGYDVHDRLLKKLYKPIRQIVESLIKFGYEIKETEIKNEKKKC